ATATPTGFSASRVNCGSCSQIWWSTRPTRCPTRSRQITPRSKCASRRLATGLTDGTGSGLPWPTMAAESPARILAGSSSLFTPQKKTPEPGLAYGCRTGSCTNMAGRFGSAAGLPGAQPEQCSPSFFPTSAKPARWHRRALFLMTWKCFREPVRTVHGCYRDNTKRPHSFRVANPVTSRFRGCKRYVDVPPNDCFDTLPDSRVSLTCEFQQRNIRASDRPNHLALPHYRETRGRGHGRGLQSRGHAASSFCSA